MRIKERVMQALMWGEPDFVPWIPKKGHTPRDPEVLDRLLKLGMGLSYPVGVVKTTTPNVTSETKIVGNHKLISYNTPVGSVSEKIRTNLPTEGGERGDTWRVERLIKDPDDYKVVRFMVEDRVQEPNYGELDKMKDQVADHGVLLTGTGYTPLMQLIVNYMGFKRLVIDLRRRREMVEDLMEAMDQKMMESMKIVSRSPPDLVNIGDNIDGLMVNPDLFTRYCIPYYQKYSEILHSGGKIAQSHMDGRLKCLKEIMTETGLDVVQAFTPPPMGDLSIKEAREAWDEKLAIWVNIPEVIFYREPHGVEEYIHSLLRQGSPGRGLVFGITETVPPSRRDQSLEAVTRAVMKHGRLPVQS